MEKVDLTIIIVHFNTPDLLKACLNSIYTARKKSDSWEVIVVDNNSTEESKKQLKVLLNIEQFKPFLKIIFENENHGFSGGNNIGIRQARGNFILLLNSDTEIRGDAIQSTMAVFSEPTVGAATCKLILPDDTIDPACHRGFPSPWAAFTYFSGLEKIFPFLPLFSEYHQLYKNFSEIHDIDVPSGAFFLIRKDTLDTVGILDEEYFMYGEDIDLAYRIRKHDYRIVFVPTGEVLHRKKQSGRASTNESIKSKTDHYFYDTMKLFYKKHYLNKYPSIITKSIFLLLDFKLWLLKNKT